MCGIYAVARGSSFGHLTRKWESVDKSPCILLRLLFFIDKCSYNTITGKCAQP